MPTFKVFWFDSAGNRTQVYRLRGGRSNNFDHAPVKVLAIMSRHM